MTRMKNVLASPEHEVAYQELVSLVARHANRGVNAEELLAIACNMVGKLAAMQDQRTMTREMVLETILRNVTQGNEQVVAELMKTKGSA